MQRQSCQFFLRIRYTAVLLSKQVRNRSSVRYRFRSFSVSARQFFMSGGWGFLLGDEGSGYDIGLKSLKVAIAYEERLGPETLMLNYIKEAWKTVRTRELIEAKFAAASGISSDFLLWSITARAIEILLHDGYAPGILKSQNYRSGKEYNDILWERYEKTGL